MQKIGIPEFKDVINRETIETLKNDISALCIKFNQHASAKAIENRESDLFDLYSEQYKQDYGNLVAMRGYAQEIADYCNKALLYLNARAIQAHVYGENDI